MIMVMGVRVGRELADSSGGLLHVTFDLPQHQFHAGSGIFHTVMSTIYTGGKRMDQNDCGYVATHRHCPE